MANDLKRMQKTVLNFFSDAPQGEVITNLAGVPKARPIPGRVIPTVGLEAGTELYTEEEKRKIGLLPKGRNFCYFDTKHMEEAVLILELLNRVKNDKEVLFQQIERLMENVNYQLFIFVLSVFLNHNPDYQTIQLPPVEEVLSEKFVDSDCIRKIRTITKETLAKMSTTNPITIEQDFSGNDKDPEHRLAYWREDIGLNAHHWHWHTVYPHTWNPEWGIVKDRRGELFYYMHQQMIARYDCERLSLHFPRVQPYNNWYDPIPEAYAPHLTSETSTTVYSYRPPNMTLKDIPDISVDRLRTWYERIMGGIHKGQFFHEDGTRLPLDNERAIDYVGDVVESASTSVNRKYYGELHNKGHQLLSRLHDPDGKYNEEIGVMGAVETAMRDPVFYRWHKFIDNIFYEHKSTLTPYTKEQLLFKDIEITSICVKGAESDNCNTLKTFWEKREINVQRGLAFNKEVPIFVRVTHLQHEDFVWEIKVKNNSSSIKEGTVRIFIAPVRNDDRKPLIPEEQRRLMIEMDKFETTFQPGENTINRSSKDSNVTVKKLKNFQELFEEANDENRTTREAFCSCGLPDYLLVPRGTPEGMEFKAFAMITDAEEDRVSGGCTRCRDSSSYCGVLNEMYPDKKPMGFPFDRRIENWAPFLTPNMNFNDLHIRFFEEVREN